LVFIIAKYVKSSTDWIELDALWIHDSIDLNVELANQATRQGELINFSVIAVDQKQRVIPTIESDSFGITTPHRLGTEAYPAVIGSADQTIASRV